MRRLRNADSAILAVSAQCWTTVARKAAMFFTGVSISSDSISSPSDTVKLLAASRTGGVSEKISSMSSGSTSRVVSIPPT